MMQRTLAQASDEYLKLLTYVEGRPDGELMTYLEVAAATGVEMNRLGKDKLRQAILRLGREYSAVPTVGYRLADTSTAMGILTSKLVRIDNSVKRANRAQSAIQRRFLDELPHEERQDVLFLGAVFGAIKLAAENGRKLYGGPRPALNGGNVVIPIP